MSIGVKLKFLRNVLFQALTATNKIEQDKTSLNKIFMKLKIAHYTVCIERELTRFTYATYTYMDTMYNMISKEIRDYR